MDFRRLNFTLRNPDDVMSAPNKQRLSIRLMNTCHFAMRFAWGFEPEELQPTKSARFISPPNSSPRESKEKRADRSHVSPGNASDSVIHHAVQNNAYLECDLRNLQNIVTAVMREFHGFSENLSSNRNQTTLHWSMWPTQWSEFMSTRTWISPAIRDRHIKFKKSAMLTCPTTRHWCKVALEESKLVG